ncbi:MAG: lasso peptide biosynthesis B2 protein [Pseudonocardia sp.]
MRPVAPPDWVRAADLGHVIVIVNYLTGGHYTLSGQACDLWRALAATGDADTVTLRIDALRIDIVDQMMCRGLLTETPTAHPWLPPPVTSSTASWGTVERDACLLRLPPTARRWRIRGALALLATLTVRGAGRSGRCLARLLTWLRFATRHGQAASVEQALSALNGVRHASRFFPARVACLEESVAAALTLTLAGYQATWCHGVAADPIRLHAWIEVKGKRVGEPASTEMFTPIMRIPSSGDDAARRSI